MIITDSNGEQPLSAMVSMITKVREASSIRSHAEVGSNWFFPPLFFSCSLTLLSFLSFLSDLSFVFIPFPFFSLSLSLFKILFLFPLFLPFPCPHPTIELGICH